MGSNDGSYDQTAAWIYFHDAIELATLLSDLFHFVQIAE